MANRSEKLRTDWMGSLIGLATFVAGIGLLAVTFQFAYSMFTVSPEATLGNTSGKVNLAETGQLFAGMVARILLLLVMSVVGSVIANRGIRLYVSCRTPAPPDEEKGASN